MRHCSLHNQDYLGECRTCALKRLAQAGIFSGEQILRCEITKDDNVDVTGFLQLTKDELVDIGNAVLAVAARRPAEYRPISRKVS